MDLYALLGSHPARRRRHQAGVPPPRAAISSGINPGDRAAEALFTRNHARRTRRWWIRSGGGHTTPGGHGRGRPVAATVFEFTGFDFSVAAHGAQAATFTELFAEVPAPGRSRRQRRGRSRAPISMRAVTVSLVEVDDAASSGRWS